MQGQAQIAVREFNKTISQGRYEVKISPLAMDRITLGLGQISLKPTCLCENLENGVSGPELISRRVYEQGCIISI
jgi:hypothetical protein